MTTTNAHTLAASTHPHFKN